MHSQPAVVFKRKSASVAAEGAVALLVLALAAFLLIKRTFPASVLSVTGFTFGLGLVLRVFLQATRPYVHLTDHHITVYGGPFLSATRHSLAGIHGTHTNEPENYIELHGPSGADPVRIPLNPLDKADRIRFIFLVESSINRKYSHRHD